MKDLLVQIPERQVGGLWAWVVCTGSFFIQFSFGFHSSFGTYFLALLDKYGRSESATAWVGSMAIGLTYFLGPLSTYLCRHLGCRIVACTGSLILIISAFLTSIVDNMMWMYLTYGVLNGLGASMLYFSSLVVLIEYFQKHLSLANGIAVSGSGIGTLCLNMMSQKLISDYGLSVTYKAMAGVYGICFLAGLTFTPLTVGPKEPRDKEIKSAEHRSLLSRCRAYFRIGEQWKNKGFIVWTIATGVFLFAYFIPSVFIISIAKSTGVPPSKGSLLVGILAVCQTVGKIGFGRLADHPRVNRLTAFQCGLLVSAVANALLPLAKSFEALVAYSVTQGVCDGCIGVLIGLVTHDIVGKRLMADALGCLYLVVAIPMTLGPPVAGMFYDHLGNYDAVFFLASALVCMGTCLMFLVPWLIPKTLPEKDELILDDDKSEEFFYDSDDDGHYDMSYVDEQKLADLFGRKKPRNLLLDRASLRNSFSSTRASSFVLFSIIPEDQHRDISTYTSRQELPITSGANTPLKGTPATRRKHFDSCPTDSRVSMYSLRQSNASVAQSELNLGQENVDPEISVTPALIHREIALETVEEVNELERKLSQEEIKPSQDSIQNILPEIIEAVSVEDHVNAIDGNNVPYKETYVEQDIQETDLCQDDFTFKDQKRASRISWASDSKTSLKSFGTQISEGTDDSGYDDSTWMGSSDVDSHYSAENLVDTDLKPSTNIIYHSYSCMDVSSSPPSEFPQFTSSDDCISYIEDSEHAVEEVGRVIFSQAADRKNKETLPHFQKLNLTEDLYSLEVEKVLELEEADDCISETYADVRLLENIVRETVV